MKPSQKKQKGALLELFQFKTKTVILTMIENHRAMYFFQIWGAFEKITKKKIVSITVFNSLKKLLKEKLVEKHDIVASKQIKYYTLTRKGIKETEKQREEFMYYEKIMKQFFNT